MTRFLQCQKVADDHPEFGQRQLKAVVKYASKSVQHVRNWFRRRSCDISVSLIFYLINFSLNEMS